MADEPVDGSDSDAGEGPIEGYGTGAVLAALSVLVGAANWALLVLVERGVRFGVVGGDPFALKLGIFLVGLVLLCVGTSLAAMAMVPRGAWPLGAAGLLANLSLAVQMTLRLAVWQTALWCSVAAGLAALVVWIVYQRRRRAGEKDAHTRRVRRWAAIVLVLALVAVALSIARGCTG